MFSMLVKPTYIVQYLDILLLLNCMFPCQNYKHQKCLYFLPFVKRLPQVSLVVVVVYRCRGNVFRYCYSYFLEQMRLLDAKKNTQ